MSEAVICDECMRAVRKQDATWFDVIEWPGKDRLLGGHLCPKCERKFDVSYGRCGDYGCTTEAVRKERGKGK